MFLLNIMAFIKSAQKVLSQLPSSSHAGDLGLPLLLLKAPFLQVGQGARVTASEHREAPDASAHGGGEILCGGGTADHAAHGATRQFTVRRDRLWRREEEEHQQLETDPDHEMTSFTAMRST